MIPYFVIFFICFNLAIFDISLNNKALKRLFLLFFGIIIVFFAGLRWETGTDWENYLAAFNNISNINFGESGYELFYEILVRISSQFSGNFTFFLFLTAIIIYSSSYFILTKFSPYPIFSLLLLLSYSLNSSGFGYRQDLAIAITLFSFYFISRSNFWLFFISVIVATFLHQSAIVFLPAYWVSKFNWNKKSIIIMLLISIGSYFLISKFQDIALLFSDSAAVKVLNYSEMSPEEKLMGNGDSIVILVRGLLNRLLLLIPPLLIINKWINRDQNLIQVFNLVLFSVFLFILLYPLGYVFLRFTRYYEIFHIILIPLSISFSSRKSKVLLITFYLAYCIFKFFFVITTDTGIYVPYKTIF